MESKDYILRFFHKGHFSRTEYLGGRCTEIPEYVESDKFSYTVVMEYVKDELKYTEIGGVYVKNVASGWKLIDNDRDLQDFVNTVEGERLDFYVDRDFDKDVEPKSQMQPHVIVRPRTQYFEALQAKRTFVTIDGLKKQRANRRSTRGKAETGQVLPKVTEYEKNRMLKVAENKRKVDELGLKHIASSLNVKNVEENVQADDEPEFDREYVPGHDSLSEAEKEEEEIVAKQVAQKQKRGKKVTNPVSRPITRSRTTAPLSTQPLSMQSEPAKHSSPVISENLPPPPQIPKDLPAGLPLLQEAPPKRYNNQGIGSMEAYMLMKDRQKTLEKEKKKVDDGGQTSHSETHEEMVETSTGAPKGNKRRGPTRMNTVYTRRPDEKKVIKLNCEFQAVADNDKDLSEFKNFLGTLGRQSVPLDLVNWHKFPKQQKDDLWNFVKTKYDIPEEGRTYTLRTIGALWRLHKSRIKKEYYLKYDNDEDRLKNRPSVISNEEFKALLKYWADEEVKDRAKKNADHRKLIVETHTAGRKSFAQIGEKIKAEKNIDPEKLAPKDDIYDKTRKRKPGHEYKTATVVADGSGGEQVKKPKHGPNWLLGRSGKCRKTMKAQQPKLFTPGSTPDIDDLKKSVREEIMAEMQEMVDRKVCEKMSKVIAKLGEINPDFKYLDVEGCLASGDESDQEQEQEDHDRDDDNAHEADDETDG